MPRKQDHDASPDAPTENDANDRGKIEGAADVFDAPEALDEAVVQLMSREAKAVLRKRARGLRSSIPKAAIVRRSAAICERLLSLEVLQRAKSVALFWAIASKNEVDLGAVDVALRARGVRVAYPSIDASTRLMTFKDPGDPSKMEPRGMLASEPDPSLPDVPALDVVVVPALYVDPRGHRLGYGAGFYDRTLPRFCPPGVSIAVAFEFQVAAELPIGTDDVACDLVVTDGGIVKG